MGFFSNIFWFNNKLIYRKCIKNYNKAKKKAPNRDERDYLKVVLLSMQPFDWQLDNVIDRILDEMCSNIDELANFVARNYSADILWQSRNDNFKDPE